MKVVRKNHKILWDNCLTKSLFQCVIIAFFAVVAVASSAFVAPYAYAAPFAAPYAAYAAPYAAPAVAVAAPVASG